MLIKRGPLAALAAEMLNFEAGRRAYEVGPEGAIRRIRDPAPEAAISVPLAAPPGAPPARAEWRPAVGTVFFPARTVRDLNAFAETIAEALSHHRRHLRDEPRAVGATLCSTHRATVRIAHADVIKYRSAGDAYPNRRPVAGISARFFWVDGGRAAEDGPDVPVGPGVASLPPHYSKAGVFTWFVLPEEVAVLIPSVHGMGTLNAVLASIYYDTQGRVPLEDGAVVYDPSPNTLRRLSTGPPHLAPPSQGAFYISADGSTRVLCSLAHLPVLNSACEMPKRPAPGSHADRSLAYYTMTWGERMLSPIACDACYRIIGPAESRYVRYFGERVDMTHALCGSVRPICTLCTRVLISRGAAAAGDFCLLSEGRPEPLPEPCLRYLPGRGESLDAGVAMFDAGGGVCYAVSPSLEPPLLADIIHAATAGFWEGFQRCFVFKAEIIAERGVVRGADDAGADDALGALAAEFYEDLFDGLGEPNEPEDSETE